MSQTYTDDCFSSGHVAQTDLQNIENNFAAIKSCFSGTDAPSNTVAGMWWFDTTNNLLKIRNEANAAWQSVWDFGNNRAPASSVVRESISGLTATITEINTTSDGSLAKNSHVHALSTSTGTITVGQLLAPTAGTSYMVCRLQDSEATTTSESYASTMYHNHYDAGRHLGVTVLVSGTITCYLQHKGGVHNYTSDVRILKNGSQQGSEYSCDSDEGYVERTWNVDVTRGDQVVFQQKTESASYAAYWRYLRVYSGTNFFAVA